MTDTQLLLDKISALRQRLEQANGLVCEADSAATTLLQGPHFPERIQLLEHQVRRGTEHTEMLGHSVQQIADAAGIQSEARRLPGQLTARARQIVEQSRDLLRRLRNLGELIEVNDGCVRPAGDHLLLLHREITALMDSVLRLLQTFPDSALGQMRMSDGLEALLRLIQEKLQLLDGAVRQRRRQHEQVSVLALVFQELVRDETGDINQVMRLGEALLEEANAGAPLHMLYYSPTEPVLYVACHCVNVAQVVARLVRHEPEFRDRRIEPVLAALIHDAGMLRVPVELLTQPGPLTDEQKRVVEQHCRHGADLAARLLPSGPWLATAVEAHHERLDGTGYPAGLRDGRLDLVTRLLSVCDIYAAMCEPRPYRPAHDPRTALTDALLLAEKGKLDIFHAERLLQLAFYPVGSIVELADGSVARVIAGHSNQQSLQAPARPVVAMLADSGGRLFPLPQFVDLAQTDGHSIVRVLPSKDRVELLGKRYPEWV